MDFGNNIKAHILSHEMRSDNTRQIRGEQMMNELQDAKIFYENMRQARENGEVSSTALKNARQDVEWRQDNLDEFMRNAARGGKSHRRKSHRRKAHRRKSHRRKSHKRKSRRRKGTRRRRRR